MSDKKISELMNTTNLTDDDIFPIVQSNLTKKIKWLHIFNIIKDYITTGLSSKLDKTIIVTETGTDLNNYIDEGRYFFGASLGTLNLPAGTNGWLDVFVSQNAVKQVWYRQGTPNSNDFNTYVRTRIGGTWSNWKQYQMVEDSGWQNLPLATGITQYSSNSQYKCQYRKVGDVVYVIGCVKGISANNATIANMPEGYRPINTYRYMTGRNTTGNSILSVATNGTISFVGLSEGATIASTDYVYIQTSFFVA